MGITRNCVTVYELWRERNSRVDLNKPLNKQQVFLKIVHEMLRLLGQQVSVSNDLERGERGAPGGNGDEDVQLVLDKGKWGSKKEIERGGRTKWESE
ncbi:hypothetical protein FRX31_009730 [Thalictrum thalictroides]|uniref:Uncharacterized protein n=1 Tax=Thalictrum thalictroides TaxID=46969 RepID=A0A7J6WX60_THATH|nr:hypothetical protein FRX31_009730 [Thalictrum thalictroides]